MLKEEIEQFLAEKRIGVVGVSRNRAKFSNKIYEKLKESGYELHPVHPEMESLNGDICVPSVRELPGDVRTLMVIASPDVCASVLEDVSPASISHIWAFSGFKVQPQVEAQIQRLRSDGACVICGLCPFMFLEPVESVHSIHRFIVRLLRLGPFHSGS